MRWNFFKYGVPPKKLHRGRFVALSKMKIKFKFAPLPWITPRTPGAAEEN